MSIHQPALKASSSIHHKWAVPPVFVERRSAPRTGSAAWTWQGPGHLPVFPETARCTSPIQATLKRGLDLAVTLPVFLVLLPLLLTVALAIRLDSKGPVIFRQRRRGYRGKAFDVLKFRTMSVMENGDQFKQARKNDSRITRIGAFLRKTSIDELPQLLNVLRGEMSLVGPRPHPTGLDSQFAPQVRGYELRWLAKPGITGLAQVNGYRGETPNADVMRKRVDFDIRYMRQIGLWSDLRILLKTVPAVISQRNAY